MPTMKILNTIIYSTIVLMIATGCNNQTKNQTEETGTNYDTAGNNVKTGETATGRPVIADTGSVTSHTADTVSKQTATEKETYSFQKSLQFKNISFNVYTKENGSLGNLSIKPNGLSETNQNVDLDINGKVTDAQVADLNADGFPELLIFTQSAGSGSYGNVIAYAVNNGKSMSRINFPATSENPQLKRGYMGHDSFSMNNSSLVQEFPIYKEGDANSNPTGGVRHVQYKLVNGEASRKFVVNQIFDIASK
jgi:hypothetical protein